jgi:uncharacterized membrane protein
MMYRYGPGYSYGGPMMGGGLGLFGVLFGVLVVIVVVLLIVWAVRASASHHGTGHSAQPASPQPPVAAAPREDPCEIAKLRYARGEIKKKEYEEICDTLKS